MLILKIISCFLIFLIIPEILGLLPLKYMKEKNNIILSFVLGYIIEFATYEIIYLPLYALKCSFMSVTYIWSILIIILFVISIFENKNNFKQILNATINSIKNMSNLIFIFIILLCIQIYFPTMYMQHIDGDDSYYLGTTNTTLTTNTLFKYGAYDGYLENYSQINHALSGLVIYFATISKILHIHPAILEHTIWPAVAMILEFSVYALIGNRLFKGDKNKLSYFLIFLSLIYTFGWISNCVNFAFFAYRSNQGKAILSNFIIPVTWLLYFYCIENSKKRVYWILFILLMIASIFATEMGVFLIPIEVGTLGIIFLLKEKRYLDFIKSIACCIPQIIVGIIYLILV